MLGETLGLIDRSLELVPADQSMAMQFLIAFMPEGDGATGGRFFFIASASTSRVVGTPAWTSKRGNHNWEAVWTSADKEWHFTEYYPDKSGKLDCGWLLVDAARGNEKSFTTPSTQAGCMKK